MSHGHLAPSRLQPPLPTRQGRGRPAPCTAAPPWLWPLSASRLSSAPASRAETEVTGLGSKIVKAKSCCPRVAWSLCAVNTIRDLLLAWVTQRLVGSPQSKTLLPPAPRHTHTVPRTESLRTARSCQAGVCSPSLGVRGPQCRVGGLVGEGQEGGRVSRAQFFLRCPASLPRSGLIGAKGAKRHLAFP